jgi:hypothetical protein
VVLIVVARLKKQPIAIGGDRRRHEEFLMGTTFPSRVRRNDQGFLAAGAELAVWE